MVKKIKVYPFDCELTHGAAKVLVDVLRIGQKGLVGKVRSGICQVARHYQCQFILPGSHIPTITECQIFKTSDGFDPKTLVVERMVEVVFVKLPDGERVKIKEFLAAVGQKE